MKKAIALVQIILLTTISRGQSNFSGCPDSLYWRLTHDTGMRMVSIQDWRDCIKGKHMVDLSLQTISGEKIKTKKLLGKVIVINLWFTGCAPCVAEIPALNQLVKEYTGKDVVFLAITSDTKEKLDSQFLPVHKFDFDIIAAGNDIIKKIGETGFPTTYIIDKNGNIRDAWIGGQIGEGAKTAAYQRAKPIIDELLSAQ
jgi:thiol-disulfide isomerase/thioredoxin